MQTKTTLQSKLDTTKTTLATQVAAIPEIPAVKLGLSLAARAESAVTRPLRRGAGMVSDVVDIVLPDEDDEVAQQDDWIAAMGKIYSQIKREEMVEPTPTPVTPTTPTNLNQEGTDVVSIAVAVTDLAGVAQVLPGKELLATLAQYQQLATKTHSRAAKMAMLKLKDAQRRAEDKVNPYIVFFCLLEHSRICQSAAMSAPAPVVTRYAVTVVWCALLFLQCPCSLVSARCVQIDALPGSPP